MVRTALTACELRVVLHIQDVLDGKHGGRLISTGMEAFSCDQRSTESSHDAGDIRADNLHTGDALKAAEHGIIVKGTALNHHVPAQL